MNAAEHDGRTALPGFATDFVPSEGIACMDADPDDVASGDALVIDALGCLVDDFGVAVPARRGRREHVEPSRSDNCRTERHVARVDEVDGHDWSINST